MEQRKQPKIIKWILVASIAIVVNLFVGYAINAAYDEPEYAAFCEEKPLRIIPETENECIAAGGQWTEDSYIRKSVPVRQENGAIAPPQIGTGYCDPDFTCRKEYQDARELYDRNVFIVLVIVGVGLIAGSVFAAGAEAVSAGLSSGGVLSLVIGSVRYWSHMDDLLRVVILGIALAALLWIAAKKFKDG